MDIYMYWMPEIQKSSIEGRFVTASSKSSIKPLALQLVVMVLVW